MACELPGLPSARGLPKGSLPGGYTARPPQDNCTNTTGETFPQRKLNIQVYMLAGGADWAVVEVLRERRNTLVLSISPQRTDSWIRGPPTVIPLSEERWPNDKDH